MCNAPLSIFALASGVAASMTVTGRPSDFSVAACASNSDEREEDSRCDSGGGNRHVDRSAQCSTNLTNSARSSKGALWKGRGPAEATTAATAGAVRQPRIIRREREKVSSRARLA